MKAVFRLSGPVKVEDSENKKFKADGFSSANILAIFVPAREELPCTPTVANDDAKAEARTGIREGMEVDDINCTRYASA
ncbi:hypothetical protein EWM64_g7259 [Hericium alpestre]|uniref:Uncharacterized protein n=1 Tax=Hericium alpestre TaxID=135208 RepID=A0A4Y9ZRT4_9AGAM|nr:hypothetical protein EWM64_g7259 [Hericium alpestre]